MRRRTAVLSVCLALPVLASCAQAQDVASRATDCAGLASDVASAGLDRTPSQAEAEQAVERLDDRIAQLDNEDVKQAASTLRDRLREVQAAAQNADPAAAQRAAAQARDAARAAAQACGVPVDQFLGG